MIKFTSRIFALVLMCVVAVTGLNAQKANYQGVMLQGFYWDSYSDTKWTNLTSQADELSTYFKLIWIPNSGSCGSGNQMGYMPQYWFTNHNSSFGTEAELRNMISTFKAKGTGMIADVVINHRNGLTNWTDFPTETWNGRTWQIGLDGICCTDEVNSQSGQSHGTGAADTGDDFNGARDLDHTNANVQDNCKNYCKFLKDDLGYAGFRYDMVKGYGGQYTKIYNEYSNPELSVGEYWDSSYDKVAAWIEATGKTSTAFDFPGRYALVEAFRNNDMTKLVWNANGVTPQPAGMIHFGYAQYAVTFIDNHDTYRDDALSSNVEAANAFILCSPGIPCVFLPHYKQYKGAIQRLIRVRNAVGLHSCSAVNVLKTSNDCYMAEVTGTNGKLVVKIGSSMDSPSGYSNSDIVATGDNYCVWTTTEMGDDPDPVVTMPSELYIMGNLKQGSWQTNVGVSMTKNGTGFTAEDVELVAVADETKAFFTLVTALGTTGSNDEWDGVINSSDRYGAKTKDEALALNTATGFECFAAGVNASSAYSWAVTPGTYDITVDFSNNTITVKGEGDDPDPVELPSSLYVCGNLKGNHWNTASQVAMMPTENGQGMYAQIELEAASGESYAFFHLNEAQGADWNAVNNGGHRYGASSEGVIAETDTPVTLVKYVKDVNASDCKSFKAVPGTYYVLANFKNNTLTLTKNDPSGVSDIIDDAAADAAPVYYNMQGVRVDEPTPGLYIVVRGSKVTKQLVR